MIVAPAPNAAFKRGDWLTLPSKRLVRLCRIEVEGAVLRYLNDDGQMAQGEFLLTLDFLRLYAKKVAHG